MFKKSIRSRVMEVLDKKFETAQAAHQEHCNAIDDQAEFDKAAHLDATVNSFVSKF